MSTLLPGALEKIFGYFQIPYKILHIKCFWQAKVYKPPHQKYKREVKKNKKNGFFS